MQMLLRKTFSGGMLSYLPSPTVLWESSLISLLA